MTPDTDPRQEVSTAVTPGKGVRYLPTEPTEIHLAKSRHPVMAAPPRPVEAAFDVEAFPLEQRRCVRTMTDEDLEVMATATREVRPRDEAREQRRAPGRRERFVAAVSNTLATALGVAR